MISFLQVEGLTKSFGDLVLFENLTFGIFEGDRIGLIAKKRNGKDNNDQYLERLFEYHYGKRRL